MKLPVLDGTIDRRILLNFRVRPEVVKRFLPAHIEPLVINGYGSAGICILRVKDIGVRHAPAFLRVTSENAAHRFLVSFMHHGRRTHGVYIPGRDTDSLLNVIAGKIFSWPHRSARFDVVEDSLSYSIDMRSTDRRTDFHVTANTNGAFPRDSMFDSLEHASRCFESCSIGISPSAGGADFKGMELRTRSWNVSPMAVSALCSQFFDNTSLFPKDSIRFDHALLMENIQHEWHMTRVTFDDPICSLSSTPTTPQAHQQFLSTPQQAQHLP
jgi:hypothetical protein